MKNNLGKILLYLLIVANLESQEYVWSGYVDKKQVYVNEAVHLHYSCKFQNKDELHVIEFNPVGSYKDYDIHLLSESETIVNGKRVNDFEFVAYLKRSGNVDFEFDVLMKKTNQDSIENTVLGRDNADYEQFSKKWIKQKKLSVEVLPNDKKLTGDFNFKVKKDKPVADAYEPYHFEIIIEGVGNFDKLREFDLNISNAKVFSSKPKKDYDMTKDGFSGVWSQKFAVVSGENFTFPSISYDYFDLKDKKIKKYETQSFEVEVKPLYKKEDLLDKEEPKKSYFKFEYIYYALFFIFGFLAGKIKINKKVSNGSDDPFKSKVKNCKNINELLTLLVINDAEKYMLVIKKIESQQIKLSEAKKAVLLDT